LAGFANVGALANRNTQSGAKSLKDLPDEDLVKAFQKGNEQAFQYLLARHEKPVYNFLFKYLGNKEAAEEAFQEVFLRVIRFIGDYKPTAKFTTWLYTIARNYSIDYSRKEKFRRHQSLDDRDSEEYSSLHDQVASNETGADEVASANQLESLLQNVLDGLNPEQKEVFLMRETQGLQFDEIAKITGASVNTVKSRMRYAVQAIQKKFIDLGILLSNGVFNKCFCTELIATVVVSTGVESAILVSKGA